MPSAVPVEVPGSGDGPPAVVLVVGGGGPEETEETAGTGSLRARRPPAQSTMAPAAADGALTLLGGDKPCLLYTEDDKAERLALCACSRVHTVAFHLAWSSFFVVRGPDFYVV